MKKSYVETNINKCKYINPGFKNLYVCYDIDIIKFRINLILLFHTDLKICYTNSYETEPSKIKI